MTFFYICIYIIRLIMVSETHLLQKISPLIVPDWVPARSPGQWCFRCMRSSRIHCACSLKVRATGTDYVRHFDIRAVQIPVQL